MIKDQSAEWRILDFDVECRPIAWYGGDFVTKQPTAIGWRFLGEKKTHVAWIGQSYDARKVLDEERAMLEKFLAAYNKADCVTGHYIRGFDLTLIQGALMRLKMPLIGTKMVQDTKVDLLKAHGISKSQENLGAMFELEHPKIPMNTALWMAGNLLLPHGIAATKKRVLGDVDQHIELRSEMLKIGALSLASEWEPGGGLVPNYVA